MEADTGLYFDAAPDAELAKKTTAGHGRIETARLHSFPQRRLDHADRNYPGAPRFSNIKTLVKVHACVEHHVRCSFETRYFISSASSDIERLSAGVRGH
jgi:hypothetical protein